MCGEKLSRVNSVIYHANDLKMSHVDSYIFSSVLDDIDTEYGKIAKMIITLGKNHKYLGMTIDYSLPVKLKLSTINTIGKIIDYKLEDMKC